MSLNPGDAFRIQFDVRWIRFMVLPELFKAMLKLNEQPVNVDSASLRSKRRQINSAGETHSTSPTEIAFFEVKHGNGSLDQSLEKRLFRTRLLGPEIFKDIVTRKVFAFVEKSNPFINARV